ncbi:hypothetical protein H310_02372 [Aphanomyces invadans]|uniref:Uncharacterized protein n=1 Tax=Aphanomyces invadans TaxID=157072 RepID=A0A024UQ84_9STRA|nr:hypothetical protein H310_02372 [Aphanomyces invadans]ETW07987.1 hypothetical protein H310_02372 [Aphanomyces invadans]|eukprot:XP_008864080.1 hypothetical protein H310_02372 [Aphanomyces invadans]
MATVEDDAADALMAEFDRPMTPPRAFNASIPIRYPSLHDLPTGKPPSSYPSFQQSTAPDATTSTCPFLSPSLSGPASVPKYPSLNACSIHYPAPTYATTAPVITDTPAIPAPSRNDMTFAASSYSGVSTSAPVLYPTSPGLEVTASSDERIPDLSSLPASPSSAHSHADIPSSPSSPHASWTPAATVAKAIKDVEVLEADAEVDVQHELDTMQSVMHHIDLALRGETPHQIAQKELREAARKERERQRLERQLAQHEQHVQRVAARLTRQSSSTAE